MEKFSLLRKALRGLGLTQDAIDDVVTIIDNMLPSSNKKAAVKKLPYHQRENFLSPAELSFYKVLQETVKHKAILTVKVNLSDIIKVKSKDNSVFRTYTNKIDRKHVDYLLCDPVTMCPLVALELDDKSHQRKDRQERDKFVNEVFSTAGLPLLHIPAQRAYNTTELAKALAPYMAEPQNTPVKITSNTDPKEPQCPQCGKEMVLRLAKKGKRAGKQFWGCPDYPGCKGVINVETQ